MRTTCKGGVNIGDDYDSSDDSMIVVFSGNDNIIMSATMMLNHATGYASQHIWCLPKPG